MNPYLKNPHDFASDRERQTFREHNALDEIEALIKKTPASEREELFEDGFKEIFEVHAADAGLCEDDLEEIREAA